MPIFGKAAKELLSRNDGVVHFGTITTIAESPLTGGRAVGRRRRRQPPGHPGRGQDLDERHRQGPGRAQGHLREPRRAEPHRRRARPTSPSTATAANDFNAYLFFTADFGATWKNVAANLPAGGTVSVVREHPKNPDVLFVGTERGALGDVRTGRALDGVKEEPAHGPGGRHPSTRARTTSSSPPTGAASGSSTTSRRSSSCQAAARARSCVSSRSAPRPSGASMATRATPGTRCSWPRTPPKARSSPTS